MSATVIPFPRVKNRAFVTRHATRMTQMAPDKGEAHLRRLLDQQMDVMRRRGIPEPAIVDEARAVEAAIRAALWHVVIFEGGSA
ncbi:MAG: hypothetical protein J0J10_17940 [Bosea sp.]|uniref:DUF6074 family protein n=1 Tax=Bosea sp. (in: a-proteobacteria) TaxID=1871050 RepID=UPI001AC92578|nr:DUF6074 family protein [Bosea sp. (in: a-proteobacteria)]MBN9470650.1 hypothetical protein [Bosea sp. (in: a-proteobacteria)]